MLAFLRDVGCFLLEAVRDDPELFRCALEDARALRVVVFSDPFHSFTPCKYLKLQSVDAIEKSLARLLKYACNSVYPMRLASWAHS